MSSSSHRSLESILTSYNVLQRQAGQNTHSAAQRDGEWFGKNLTLAGGHFGCPLGTVPLPNAGDEAWSLQLMRVRALECDHRPHGRAVAVDDLQRAELGRDDTAALPCSTETKQDNGQGQQRRFASVLSQSDCKPVQVTGRNKSQTSGRAMLTALPRTGPRPNPLRCHSAAPLPWPTAQSEALLVLQHYLLRLVHIKHC